MGFKDGFQSLVRELGEERLDNGSRPRAMHFLERGLDRSGRRLLDDTGRLKLAGGERVLGRADFKRFGLAVLYAPRVTTATRNTMFDLEKDVDLTVTNRRVVAVVDDLTTKGGWSGDGLAMVVAPVFNAAHAVGSKLRHLGESIALEVELSRLNRVLAPSVPTFPWAAKRSLCFGWQEDRNLGVGDLRVVLLDQRSENDHLTMARMMASEMGLDPEGRHNPLDVKRAVPPLS